MALKESDNHNLPISGSKNEKLENEDIDEKFVEAKEILEKMNKTKGHRFLQHEKLEILSLILHGAHGDYRGKQRWDGNDKDLWVARNSQTGKTKMEAKLELVQLTAKLVKKYGAFRYSRSNHSI